MSLFKELEKQGGRPGSRIGFIKKCPNKKIPDIPDIKYTHDSDNLVFQRPGARENYRPHPYYTDFDELEADRIAKFGSKVRLDLEQPLSSQQTVVETEDGVSRSVPTPTLREFLVSQLHKGKTVLSSNPAKTINDLMNAIDNNVQNIQPRDIDKIKEVLIETISDRKIVKLDKQYVTLNFYKRNTSEVLLTLANNATVLRGGMSDKLVKSLNGNWVNETEIRRISPDLVIDVTNCQITRIRDVDPNEILDYTPTPPGSPTPTPLAVPTEIPYTRDQIGSEVTRRINQYPTGAMSKILSFLQDNFELLVDDIDTFGKNNQSSRADLIDDYEQYAEQTGLLQDQN